MCGRHVGKSVGGNLRGRRFRQGGGDRVHYAMDTMVGLLEFHRHSVHNIMYISRVRLKGVGGCFYSFIRILVNIMRECSKFGVHIFGKILHSFGKKFFRN